MRRVVVIDYGMGNLRSVEKALRYVAGPAWDVVVTQAAAAVEAAERVVFPGQGAFGDCLRQIRAHDLEASLARAAREKPFLGICIGLQALFEASEEDPGTPGLGLYPGTCRRFPGDRRDPATGERLKIPHMGWNEVHAVKAHPLWEGIPAGTRFYFVHGYYAEPADATLVAGRTEYALPFASAIAQGPVFAVQFHPEKSQRPGLRLLANFLAWDPGRG